MLTNNLLPHEAIEEFKTIYSNTFNVSLTTEEAQIKAEELFSMYDAVYGKRIRSIKKT